MKDFKKMPKMACGGGVKKMALGGSTNDVDWSKAKPVEMPYKDSTKVKAMVNIGDQQFEMKDVKMPLKTGNDVATKPNAPGDFTYRYAPGKAPKLEEYTRGLKTGGKVKRGKVTKK